MRYSNSPILPFMSTSIFLNFSRSWMTVKVSPLASKNLWDQNSSNSQPSVCEERTEKREWVNVGMPQCYRRNETKRNETKRQLTLLLGVQLNELLSVVPDALCFSLSTYTTRTTQATRHKRHDTRHVDTTRETQHIKKHDQQATHEHATTKACARANDMKKRRKEKNARENAPHSS